MTSKHKTATAVDAAGGSARRRLQPGPVVHGVLLAAALLFAYQTWTREDKVERKVGNVKVWSSSPSSLTAIEYQTKNRTVRVEPRGEGSSKYLWGIDTRVIKKPKPKPPKDEEGGLVLPEPEPEEETKVREFAIGDKGEHLVEELSNLRALIDLGPLEDDKKVEYGLADAEDSVDVFFTGNVTRSLLLGAKVYGGADRYALHVDSGRAYVIAGEVLRELLLGEAGLKLVNPHAFEDDEVGKVAVAFGDKVRSLVKIKRADEQGKETVTWADASSPDKPDQTMDNFLKNVSRLRPDAFEPELSADSVELLVKVTYQRQDGGELGWLELYKEKQAAPEPEPAPAPTPAPGTEGAPAPAEGEQPATPAAGDKPPAPSADSAAPAAGEAPAEGEPAAPAAEKPKPPAPPKYYLRTELTRVFAETSAGTATRIAEDLDQLFTE